MSGEGFAIKLAEAMKYLADRTEAYEEAKKQSSYARNQEVDCLNAVNQAQASVDKLLLDMKNKAPHGTDWFNRDQRKP